MARKHIVRPIGSDEAHLSIAKSHATAKKFRPRDERARQESRPTAGRATVAHHAAKRNGGITVVSIRSPASAGRLKISDGANHRVGSTIPCFSSNSLHSIAKSIFR